MDRLSSTGHDIIVSVVAMAIVASIAVFLRLGAKRLTKAGLTVDDYWIMFALVSFWVYVGVMLWGMFNGAGGESMTNISHFKFSGYEIFLKSIRIDIPLFGVTITSVKLSLLSLYHRIFSAPWVRRSSIALSVLCVLWLIVIVVDSIFVCFFTQDYPYGCIDFGRFFLILCLVEVLIDIAILCLPLRMISGLQLPLQHKIILSFTFLVGGFVCITGIIRVALTYAPHSGFVVIKCLMWSNIQLGTAITCACILTYRPLLTKCVIFYGVLVHHNNKPQHGKPEEEGSWSSHKNLRSQTHRPES